MFKELTYGQESGNMLIYGDNLPALQLLQDDYAQSVKCVCIDPPYNTGAGFLHYDDNISHSAWLSMMKPRLQLLWPLLAQDGSIWICIDDNEHAYLKVLCDELFGRAHFITSVVWRSSHNSNNDCKRFSRDHNIILVYAKSEGWRPNKLKAKQTKYYSNPDNDPRGPWFDGNPLSSPSPRPKLTYDIVAPNGNVIKPPFNGWRWSRETLEAKMKTGEIRFNSNNTGLIRRTYLNEHRGLPPSTLWADLNETGHTMQAKKEQMKLFPEKNKNEWFATPKPEKLIHKILTLATAPGDLVLDSFLGSGTTAAVAHKMNRRWIGIEQSEQAYTYSHHRLKAVVDGEPGGISKTTNWKGGGGFTLFNFRRMNE